MAFSGFGRDSGPSAPPKSQPLFGLVSRPPQVPPSTHLLQRSTIHQAPRDLDAPEEPPFYSGPLKWTRPVTDYTSTAANLNRDLLLSGGDKKNTVENDTSKRLQNSQSEMPSQHPGIRAKFKITQDRGQMHSHVQADETSLRSMDRLGVGRNITRKTDAQPILGSSTSSRGSNAENAVSYVASKRTRSPPIPTMQIFQGKPHFDDDETERELQAKAKRLARFKTELSVPFETNAFIPIRNDLLKAEKQRVLGDDSMESIDDVENDHLQPTGATVGLCPDMCPVSEREERERKGDLDQYERLDGERNRSSQEIAVKKYNRTAERDAELIRPIPILNKTMEYLLCLLNQPYDERFLGLYNFLWDRMRAIRMDLRMQHIFNLEAVSMLEQMIRLHIIAMHELCEYTRGEGFSEGFDAHLNIEQMNKTSVELFQMYDDHRKRGIDIQTEKEFRGYYALLKLDKHPGYKVEPSELSLDLAQMTRQTRQTQEVLFARKVARSCRIGNFISFFRLARKATYLQSCLMHAHFSKLRTQALASLHCGVQNNQGIPVSHVSKWLGLEEESVEDLLDYHGFQIKEFEEPYVVKDGPFLNSDKDYPTRCSELVKLKKSKTIVEDVLSSHQEIPEPQDKVRVTGETFKPLKSPGRVSSHTIADEEMNEMKESPAPRSGMILHHGPQMSTNSLQGYSQSIGANTFDNRVQLNTKQPPKDHQHHGNSHQPVDQGSQLWNISVPKLIPEPQLLCFDWTGNETVQIPAVQSPKSPTGQSPNFPAVKPTRADEQTPFKSILPGIASEISEDTSGASHTSFAASLIQHDMVIDEYRNDERTDVCQLSKKEVLVTDQFDEEVAKAKLKLWVRLWRRRSLRKRQMSEQNRLTAFAAMNSLSVGPPLKRSRDRSEPCEIFDIDEIMIKRYDKYDHSWSRINVADLVGDQLCEINANSQCICWKIILYSPTKQEGDCSILSDQATLDQWLHAKLMPPSGGDCNDGLVTSFPGLAIWRKWIFKRSDVGTCCLSVVKGISFLDPEKILGANGILFSISERVTWEHQKIQLHNLVSSLRSGAAASLLILSDSSEEEFLDQSTYVNQLGVANLDKSKIRNFRFVHLRESCNMKQVDGYYSDEQLREGLKWLAAESHQQPTLLHVKTRELVMVHLNSSLEALKGKSFQEIDPNQCILSFNETLDKSIEHIVAAANSNPLGWPCPELSLLNRSSTELRAVKLFLPCVGWSSQEKIDSLVSTLCLCKLPAFLEETSFLHRGSCTFDEFEEQRLHLQDCLISYLNQSSKLMSLTLSLKEADAMLQKGARLELRGSSYYLVANWAFIFRRIFYWRLNRLSGRSWSRAYILEQHHYHRFLPGPAKLEQLDVGAGICQPSLNELVEVSFRVGSPSVSISTMPQPQASQNVLTNRLNGICKYSEDVKEKSSSDENNIRLQELNDRCDASLNISSDYSGQNLTAVSSQLSTLLEQCNILQNKIADKLSIYF